MLELSLIHGYYITAEKKKKRKRFSSPPHMFGEVVN